MFGLCSAHKSFSASQPSFYMNASSETGSTTLRVAVTLLFVLSGASQLLQLVVQLVAAEPHWARAAFHLVCGSAGIATAYAAWTSARWGWIAVSSWGIATAALLLSLSAMGLVTPQEEAGLPAGAIAVVIIAMLTAWYLRRSAARERT
jgi:hypothetical protein